MSLKLCITISRCTAIFSLCLSYDILKLLYRERLTHLLFEYLVECEIVFVCQPFVYNVMDTRGGEGERESKVVHV